MKILITGIHGFVGSNLVEYLKGNNTIYGLDIVSPEKDGVEKTFSWEDLDGGKVHDVDAIIHLAGKAHDTKNNAASDVYFKVNTGLTQKIFDYFLSGKTNKFIFFSTAKAAADKVDTILTEEVMPKPVGPYGESKIKAEEYIQSHLDMKAASEKKSVYILRPCMIHGPGNNGNIKVLYSVVSKGVPWPLGAFNNERTFTSIENICFAVNALLTQDIPSGIYNMGDDKPISTNELIEMICSVLGKKARIWHINRGLMTMCARIGTVLHLPLNSERLQKLTENYISSNAKIKKALRIEKFPVEAREGLRRTIKGFGE